MAHTIRHTTTGHGKSNRLDMRRVRLWITRHSQVCACCGLALWGRRYTTAAFAPLCRSCYLAGLPTLVIDGEENQQGKQQEEEEEPCV